MTDAPTPDKSESADNALDRLEAALETIARGLHAPKPAEGGAASEVLGEVEQRLDAAIDHVKAALGRKSDQ
jgi:hypothetical protein